MANQADRLKEILSLQAHPGPSCSAGYFRQTYECEDAVRLNKDRSHSKARSATVPAADYDDIQHPENEPAERYLSAATSVYFLLEKQGFTTWQMHMGHDEVLMHHEGEMLKVHTITQDGTYKYQLVGSPLVNAEARPQALVPRYTWMANELLNKSDSSYALISAFVIPGYDTNDAKVANTEELIKDFPQHKQVILRFAPLQNTPNS